VQTNSTLLPERAALAVRLLDTLSGDGRLRGLTVLDAGCGLGALTGFLASRYTPERILGVDTRADYTDAARRAAATAGLDAVEYRVEDLRSLESVPDASVDVVLAINSIGWAGGKQDAAAAARAFARVLRPGGRVLVQQASPWRLRDPLAKGAPLHLLPAPIARGVARVTGSADHHGRVRFLRPGEMRGHLRRAGFEQVRAAGVLRDRILRGPVTPLAAYYAVGARRPR
jgi:SAM-dependent methyltransferase